jgi:hypothetical protein
MGVTFWLTPKPGALPVPSRPSCSGRHEHTLLTEEFEHMRIKHSVLAMAVVLGSLTGALATTQAQAADAGPRRGTTPPAETTDGVPVPTLAASPTVSPAAEKAFHTGDAGLVSCPRGRYCTETWDPTTNSWKIHVFYQCGTYTLYDWERVGALINNQTGGAVAKVLDKNKNVIWSTPANNEKNWGNWSDAWYIRPC